MGNEHDGLAQVLVQLVEQVHHHAAGLRVQRACGLVREKQIDEALRTKEALDEAKKVIEERKAYYDGLIKDGLNAWEVTSLTLTGGGNASTLTGAIDAAGNFAGTLNYFQLGQAFSVPVRARRFVTS